MATRRVLAAAALVALAASARVLGADAPPAPPAWPKSLTLAAASSGDAYLEYGRAWAEIAGARLGTRIAVQQTEGGAQNLQLTHDRITDFGMASIGLVQQAWSGAAEWTRGRTYRHVRALFAMYDAPFLFVALEKSGLRAVRDLQRRKAGVGPRGSGCATAYPELFAALGLDVTLRHGPVADMSANLQDGLIEAFPSCSGTPVPAYQELEAQNRVRYFGFAPDEIRRLRARMPYLAEAAVPKGTYRQQPDDIRTVAMAHVAFAHKDFPEELAYALTKTVLESGDALAKAHPAARETVLESWKRNTALPFHAGALRYLKERGIAVPAALSAPGP